MSHINIANILTVAQAERRLTRRLKRYWLFLILSYVAGGGVFFYYSVLHAFFSSFSATLGTINPHYLLSVYGLIFQIIFTIGIVFIGFDIRARDVRERIVEVLDCRPVSNFELVTGRFLALFQMAWIPMVIFCLLLQLIAALLPLLGITIGDTIELYSVLNFIFLLTIPNFCFSIGLVFLVTLLVKNRVLSTVVSIGVLGGLMYAMYRLPVFAYPLIDNFGATVATTFPSDILARLTSTQGLLQRGGYLALGLAFLGLSVALHPRLDDGNRRRTSLISAAILLGGMALLATSSVALLDSFGNAQWTAAHQAVEAEPEPDILSVNGVINIEPGRELRAALTLEVQAPAAAALDSALFTLNPGFTLQAVTDAAGQPLPHTFENGLLRIAAPMGPGESRTIQLDYAGKPDQFFAYLDSRLKFESLTDFNARGLHGVEPAMFVKSFVALMPGNYWLPLAGNDINRDDTRARPRDFFSINLEVEVPRDWLVAGPGRRQSLDAGADSSRFRFAPEPQLSEVALVASRYTPFVTDINGIHFELLLHPAHTRNLSVLSPLQDEIEAWLASRLDLAADAGLNYPFDAFTLVEVPNGLRVYKGGWRMDTALAPPAMMLMNESGFPTSRFDFNIRTGSANEASGATSSQGIGVNAASFRTNVNFDRLQTFFTNDLSGGNVFMGMSRSYFGHHTVATGEEAIALNFILDMLANLVMSEERYYFSMYNDINATVTSLISTIVGGGTLGESVTQRTISSLAEDVAVWNNALKSSLAVIDTANDPEATINLLTLKGGELAQAIYDSLGAQQSGELLATLLQNHRYGTFTMADVVAFLESRDAALAQLFAETLYSSELPGFVVDGSDLFRLPDGTNGEQRYQLLVRVRNDEPVPGFTRIAWVVEGEEQEFFNSRPFRIAGRSAVEFGVVLSQPPRSALVNPYLSLNRGQFLAGLFIDTAAIPSVEAEAFEGVRDIVWDNSSERIIADDLDRSFVVIDDNGESDPDRVAADGEAALDQGIRINTGNTPVNWNRISATSAYGHYRHTYATILAGEGDKKAILTSEIPAAGVYDLEIHIPTASVSVRQDDMRGVWNLEIVSEYGREKFAFDNRAAIDGWNLVGSFDLPAGEVKIEVTNQTDAIVVRVDAFAWTPVNTN